MAIKVSASIVTYNDEDSILDTIESVLKSTDSSKIDLKIYIFDNGSSDGTINLINETFKDDCRVKVSVGDNDGFGAGHNRILKENFDSKYHCVINPDIVLREDAISSMVEYAENNSDVVLLSPRILSEDGEDQILGKRYPHIWYLFASHFRGEKTNFLLKRYAMLDKGYDSAFEIWNATGCFMFFRTDAFKKINGFDDRYFMYFEDCDITREMRELGKVMYYPLTSVYHIWARDSKTNKKLKIIHIQSMLKYDLKWRTI